MDSWSYGAKNFVSDDFVSQNGMLMMRNQEFEGSGSSIRDVFLSGPKFGIGGQEESRNSFVLEPNFRDSSLIDLKLGRFLDHKDGHSKANLPAKRSRNGALSSQKPFCQVHGCRKDLSSCKDYHKRHKVCEIHSKTTKVIVNGIEQRFCQQCSRFHLLAEFDDGKRSCRKRLAGHNERRRKPHISIHSGRDGRGFHTYSGSASSGLERPSSVLSSFVCQDILPGNVLHSQKYGMQDWQKAALKVEDGCDYVRFSNASSLSLCEEDGGLSKMNHKYNHPTFMQNLGFHNTSHSQNLGFHNLNPIGSDQDFALLDPSTTSSYGCALSLLSSQSHNNSSVHSSAPSAHYSIAQVSEKLMRVSPQTSASTGVTNSAASLIEPILISEGSNNVNYGFNRMSIPGAENGCPTIDLLQLSSQLQRVEHERQRSMKVKEDNNAFFGLRII